jgi:hypothetical protein
VLQTDAAFDQDFNFISKLERDIERNEQQIEDRDITGNRSKKFRRGAQFWEVVREKRVLVHRAPEGMSRERANHSYRRFGYL